MEIVSTTFPKWEVSVKGEKCSECWEISVVMANNEHGFKSHGWIGGGKLLIGGSGGPCQYGVIEFVWDGLVELANALCTRLNNGELYPDYTTPISTDPFRSRYIPNFLTENHTKISVKPDTKSS